jgi:putative methionine-R-sulfoxide reductase with GAF domain
MSVFQNIKPDTIPPFLQGQDDLHIQREIVLQHILNTTVLFSLIVMIYWVARTGESLSVPLYIGAAVICILLIGLTIFRQLPFALRTIALLVLVTSVGLLDLLTSGIGGTGTLYMFSAAVTAMILLGLRGGAVTLILALITEGVIGWLYSSHLISLSPALAAAGPFLPGTWIYTVFSTLLCGICIAGGVYQFSFGLARSLKDLRSLTRTIERDKGELEKRIEERTVELAHKATQLEAARQVASRIASQPDLDSLLINTVNVIREQFNFYYSAIFLPDENNEYAVLHAGTGDAGKHMLEKGHRLRIGQVGIVGYVMSTGEPRITGNVDEDPTHYKNPDLTETRSEMAVPMKLSGKTVGVLDVQSSRRNAFSADDVDVLLTIADQLASALDKVRLLKEYQKSLLEIQESTRQITRSAWQQHLRNTHRNYAYRFRQMKVEQVEFNPLHSEKILWSNDPADPEQYRTLQVPIELRGLPLGMVNLKMATNRITPEMMELVSNAVNRMAASLENVRLVEEIQTRAERERLVGDIATNIETILQTTASELGRSLGVAEVVVQLASNE